MPLQTHASLHRKLTTAVNADSICESDWNLIKALSSSTPSPTPPLPLPNPCAYCGTLREDTSPEYEDYYVGVTHRDTLRKDPEVASQQSRRTSVCLS